MSWRFVMAMMMGYMMAWHNIYKEKMDSHATIVTMVNKEDEDKGPLD